MKRSLPDENEEGTKKKTKSKEWVAYGDDQFSGEMVDGLPIKGTLKIKNDLGYEDNVYEGEFKYGKPHGKGVMIYHDSNTPCKRFEGEFKAGLAFKGVMEYEEGDVYEGEIGDDDGEWPDGKGVLIFGEREKIFKKFVGEFKVCPFRGVMEFHNGDVYDGTFEDGFPFGKGVMIYGDKNKECKRFDGEWAYLEVLKGKMLEVLKGKMKYRNGNVYDGEFKDGKRHGKGIIIYAADYRKRFNGEWKDDYALKGILELRNGDVYDGEFKGDITEYYHGEGIMKYANGDVYDGEWEEDEKNGEGVMNYANGEVYEGEWKDDQFHGLGHFKYKQYKTKEYEGHFERGDRHGRGRFVLDGVDEPYQMWERDKVVANVLRTGMAYEIHNATNKVNLEKYLEIIRDAPPLVNNVQDTFETFMRDHRFPDESFAKLKAILGKISPFTDIEEKSWAFVFSQPVKFVEFYIQSFIQDCYHAYDGENGLSCVAGIRERTYMIVGDAAFALCADKYHCDNPLYLELNKVFHKHININEFAQEWTSQISPELKKSSTVKRVRHFMKFMKAKYKYLNLYTVDVRRQIRKLAEDWHYIFDAETNPEMNLGGGGRRRLRTKRRKSTSFRKTRQHRRKSTPMWSR